MHNTVIHTLSDRIYTVRGYKVMMDSDLAEVFEITTKRLNELYKRNENRFPTDFVFQLTENEEENLRSQFATSSYGYGGRRYLPYVFTEHGAIMIATLLRSDKAAEMSVYIVRAFVAMRNIISQTKELAGKIELLEEKLTDHDDTILSIIRALREMTDPKENVVKPIGYIADIKENKK